MRALSQRLFHTACLSLLGVGMAAQAHAAVLPFTGSLTELISAATNLPPITVAGSGSATLNPGAPALSSLALAGGTFALPFVSLPGTTGGGPVIIGEIGKNILNRPGSFNLGGKMGIQGTVIICFQGSGLCPTAGANIVIPLTMNGTRGVGMGGAFVPPPSGNGAVHLTVNGNPWTVGTAMVGGLTIMGFVHGPASGGAATAGQVSGVVQLVTPTLISTSIGASATLPSFGILNLHFSAVPEPSTLLLLTSGFALVALGRRMQK